MWFDEEREYQAFFAKTMHAAKEFVDDYNNLSPRNKAKFQQALEQQAAYDAFVNIMQFLKK